MHGIDLIWPYVGLFESNDGELSACTFQLHTTTAKLTISCFLTQDGLIHKDEFALALFKAQNQSNLFVEKVRAGGLLSSSDHQAVQAFHRPCIAGMKNARVLLLLDMQYADMAF